MVARAELQQHQQVAAVVVQQGQTVQVVQAVQIQ
jgi:hypothetical protein